MNLKSRDYSSESDDSMKESDYKMIVSKRQSTLKFSSSKSSSSDESLTDMIRKRRLQINKNVYAKEEQIDQIDATFDLSDTFHDKQKNLNESTLESRIKKLEQELNTSLKSTQQRNYNHNDSASLTSVDSFSIDYQPYQQSEPRVNYYNNRLESIRSKNSEPPIEWKKGRKIEEFDFEISNLQQELDSLKDSINKEEADQNKKKVKLKHQLRQYTNSDSDENNSEYREVVYDLPVQRHTEKSKKQVSSSKKSSIHSQPENQNLFKKKSRVEEEPLDPQTEKKQEDEKSKQKQLSILKHDSSSDHLSDDDDIPKSEENNGLVTNVSKKQSLLQHLPISAIELKQKDGTDVSLDVVPQKHQSKGSGPILTENQQPNILGLPSKTSLQCDVSRLYKLNKEVEVLKQIEKIRTKLKKSINQKLNSEKVIEQYDPSFTMQSKTKSMNKSGKLHCPNCTYLLNKGMSSAYCHCNK